MNNRVIKSPCSRVLFVLCCVRLGCCAYARDLIEAPTTTSAAVPTTGPAANHSTSIADEKCREYSNIIYSEKNDNYSAHRTINKMYCNITTFIVGGKKAVSKEFPHMVLLGYVRNEGKNEWHCGGSLISERWVLTAAHCLDEDPDYDYFDSPLWARLGELNYLSYTEDTRPKNFEIVERVVHPNYKPPALYNDIALLRLENDVEFSEYVRPICLCTDRSLKTSTAVATGWGRTDVNAPINSDLLKAVLELFPVDKCKNIYPVNVHLPHGIDDESMVCTGSGGKNVCKGDSGSALHVEHPNYMCMHTQIGVTSFGYKCGKYDEPSVFTKVSNYIPWIEKIVWPVAEQSDDRNKKDWNSPGLLTS